MKTKVSVDVRVDPSDKARWQSEAEERGISMSDLVRERMNVPRLTPSPGMWEALAQAQADIAAEATLDLASDELQSLRAWLDLRDSDGDLDPELLTEWKAIAERHGITFDDLLERVVVYANAAVLA